MSTGMDRRLQKLEAAMLPPGGARAIRALTWDEMQVRLMELSLKLANDPSFPQADRDEAAARVAEIEEGIRHQARAHLQPDHARHLAYVAGDRGDYVPAVSGDHIGDGVFADAGWAEYEDLHKSRIMARRAALRARPDIARLIAEGTRA